MSSANKLRAGKSAAGSDAWFLQGGGVSGDTARKVPWEDTSLGSPHTWPATLKTTIATMFCARQPMFLWWGPELIQFYNDAYLPSFGKGKHPRAMGQRGRECWGEIWPIIGPQIEDVMERGLGSFHEDALVPIFRNEKIEEVYWTYTYSPVFDEDASIAGSLVICTETTSRVLAERRANTLHELVSATSLANDMASLRERALGVLGKATLDLPFVLFCGGDMPRSSVATSTGLEASSADAVFELAASQLESEPGLIALGEGLELTHQDHGPEPVREAYVAPLSRDTPPLCLVFGLSPRLPFAAAYLRFLQQINGHLKVAMTRIEEAARRTSVELERRNLLEQAPVATALMVGPKHVFELANPVYRQMVGRSHLVGKAYLEAFPEAADTPLPGILDRVYREGKPFATNEYRIPIDKGTGIEDCYFKFNLEPVRNVRGQVYGMMAIAIEITEQVTARHRLEKAHAERERLLRDVEQASRAKDEFLAMLGHELRNPLSPIQTALQLMRHKAGGQPAREQEVIQRQVDHLIRLVDDLLDVARIARGKVDLRREVVDLAEIVGKAVETASDLLEQRRHQLSIDCERRRLYCYADPVRLSQVVANLLTNAARYTEPGGQIEVRATAQEGELVLSVKDNGTGIPEEMLPHLFKVFEQGKRSPDRSQGGLGIGLALVKNLVMLHGGSVSAHSEGVGRGSEFVVRLKAATGSERPSVVSTAAAELRSTPVPKRVLVVDDNVDAAELLQSALQTRGHEVAMATDVLIALELAADFEPEVAVLDIGLPVLDGYELARRLRALPNCASCRLIALTGYGQEHDRRRSREAGFEEHLVKPVDFERLSNVIDA